MSDRKTEKAEDKLDDALDDTFPASDPPSNTPTGGTKKSREMEEAHDTDPKGAPTSDRQDSETAGQG